MIVISTGGGLPITPGNLEHLKRAGAVVFLKASLEDILKRLERDTRRPKVQGGDLRETVTRLLDELLPVYEQADLVVVRGDPVTRIADIENVELVFKHGIGYDPARLIDAAQGLVGLR